MWYAGDWKQAHTHWERAEALMRHVPVSWRKTYPLLALGTVDLVEGQWEPAQRRLQEALTIAQGCGDIQAQRIIQWFLAERDLLQGQPEAARARLEPIVNLANKEHAMTEVLHVLAWAYLDLGDPARAEEVLSTGLARARPDKRWSYVVELLRVQALIRLRQSHWTAAEAALEETLTLARDVSFYLSCGRRPRPLGLGIHAASPAGECSACYTACMHLANKIVFAGSVVSRSHG
jgi:tetratricopeptide (TPR) repeat protein